MSLSLMFNIMPSPGCTPTELLNSTIIFISKDYNKVSLLNPDNYRGISLFNFICTVLNNMLLFTCITRNYNPPIYNF